MMSMKPIGRAASGPFHFYFDLTELKLVFDPCILIGLGADELNYPPDEVK